VKIEPSKRYLHLNLFCHFKINVPLPVTHTFRCVRKIRVDVNVRVDWAMSCFVRQQLTQCVICVNTRKSWNCKTVIVDVFDNRLGNVHAT
jgi:hypothetical protein